MIPCRDFIRSAEAAISIKPEEAVCFFSVRKVIQTALDQGQSWAIDPDGTWGGSVSLPMEMVFDFLKWERKHVRPDYRWDDGRLALYLVHGIRRPVWHTVPSLLEHGAPGESLVGNGDGIKRTSQAFIGIRRSGLEIDWSRGASSPVVGKGAMSKATHNALMGDG